MAQREGKQTKEKKHVEDEAKQRNRSRQDQFHCGGLLRITSNETNRGYLRLELTHALPHIPYCNITPSDEIKETVKKLSGEYTPNEMSLHTYSLEIEGYLISCLGRYIKYF